MADSAFKNGRLTAATRLSPLLSVLHVGVVAATCMTSIVNRIRCNTTGANCCTTLAAIDRKRDVCNTPAQCIATNNAEHTACDLIGRPVAICLPSDTVAGMLTSKSRGLPHRSNARSGRPITMRSTGVRLARGLKWSINSPYPVIATVLPLELLLIC